MEPDVLQRELAALQSVLSEIQKCEYAQSVRAALEGSLDEVRAFLVSNELWGGAGSIADQAGMDDGRKTRQRIESALDALGKAQIRQGVVNSRTAMWVDVFEAWNREGI